MAASACVGLARNDDKDGLIVQVREQETRKKKHDLFRGFER